MSNIQDMNNRIRQNRDQRPSKRAKFKENNREAIHTDDDQKSSLQFKKVSEIELEQMKKSIRNSAQIEQKRTRTLLISFVLIVLLVTIGYILFQD